MLSSDKKVVQLLIDQCHMYGVRRVVISPGSRNAPLSIAFDEHPAIQTFVVHDERSAAFFALGMSEELNEPVALCCTSGSAALNYFPAISEAYYRCIPLIVITADRPNEWINQGDGQTIMQQHVFGNHVRYSTNLDDADFSANKQWKYQLETALAFNSALSPWKGPIHFNVSLSEPLYHSVEKTTAYGRKITQVPTQIDWNQQFSNFLQLGLESEKILVLCGQMPKSASLQIALIEFAKRDNVAILTDNTANLSSELFNNCIDRSIQGMLETDKENLSPTLLITLGGAIVSKNIKNFIRKYPPNQHWRLGYQFPGMDTYQCLSHELPIQPALFFQRLNEGKQTLINSTYNQQWKSIDKDKRHKAELYTLNSSSISDLLIFKTIFELIPDSIVLHMSNSSVIRYCQLFDTNKTIDYRANRGTSGIDGSTSTALGAAVANPNREHLLITGDISFAYDSNALWNKYVPKNLKIIVINNQGGGIFKIIPGSSTSKQLNPYFEAEHDQQAVKIAAAYGLSHAAIMDQNTLFEQLHTFLTTAYPEASLLEIFSDSKENPIQFQAYLNFLTS